MKLLDRLRGRTEQDVFAEAVLRRLKQQGRRGFTYDRDQFALLTPDGQARFLQSAYLQALDEVSPELLDATIEGVLDPEDHLTYEAAKDRLLPAIGNRMMGQLYDLAGDYAQAARRPLADVLEIHLVVDRRLTSRIVTHNDLQAWGMSFDDLLDVAVKNLQGKAAFAYKPMKDGFRIVAVGDAFDASRILLPHVFDELRLSGGPVVSVVSRNFVAVAGRDDHGALKSMAAFVDDVLKHERRPIACAPIIRDDDAWVALELRPDDAPAVRHLIISQALMDHEGQTTWLRNAAGRAPGVAIADYNVTRDGRSWSEWRRDETTLLPKVDALVLVDHPRAVVCRTWDDAEKVLGPFEVEPELYPPRYRVPAWSHEARDQLETTFEPPPWIPQD